MLAFVGAVLGYFLRQLLSSATRLLLSLLKLAFYLAIASVIIYIIYLIL